MGGVWKFIWFRREAGREAGRDPDREDGHYADIYIDSIIYFEMNGEL